MRLLILTQSVDRNDPNLGAFYGWWKELAKRCDSLVIVALRVGAHDLPAHVKVISAGKESGRGHFSRRLRFLYAAVRELPRADAVFSHMIPEYVVVVGPLARLLGKKVYLWYAHGATPWTLHLALPLLTRVFTSSLSGFSIASPKVVVTGQAIDTALFTLAPERSVQKPLRLVTAGRISQVKHIERMLGVLADFPHAVLTVIGEPITSKDSSYLKKLQDRAERSGVVGRVHFVGSRAYAQMPAELASHDLFLNCSTTGSLDKAVLEAMSCGLPVCTSNPAFIGLLPERNVVKGDGATALRDCIHTLAASPFPDISLRKIVESTHSLPRTIGTITDRMLADTR